VRLGELLGRKIVTESGLSLGRVHDVQGELKAGHVRVTGLVPGRIGLLARFGVGEADSSGPDQAKSHRHPAIPWERVVRIGREIVVRD
jgi:sporulation protein YlmC with PRC-barrel domain